MFNFFGRDRDEEDSAAVHDIMRILIEFSSLSVEWVSNSIPVPSSEEITSPLCSAVWQRNRENVEKLLQEGGDVNEKMNNGHTPIFFAVKLGDMEMAKLLLQHKAQVNISDNNGLTPLHLACYFHHKDIVSLLLKENADVNAESKDGGTPLLAAIYGTHDESSNPCEVISMLIKKGANVNAETKTGLTALHYAVKKDNCELVDLLLSAKANVNATIDTVDRPMVPLFHVAVYNGQIDIVRSFLADERLNLKMRERDYKQPLHVACHARHLPIVKLLVEKKFNINAMTMYSLKTPLTLAMEMGYFEIAKYLLEQDTIDLSSPHPFAQCRSPFIMALEASKDTEFREEVIKAIIDRTGDDVNMLIEQPHPTTPLMLAVSKQDVSTAEYLLQRGADVNKKLPGVTNELIHLLMGHLNHPFADRKAGLKVLCSPLQLACQEGNNGDMVKLLLAHGASVNDGPKETLPLTLAIETGELDMVKELLDYGAEVSQDDVDRNLAMQPKEFMRERIAGRKRIDELLKQKLMNRGQGEVVKKK